MQGCQITPSLCPPSITERRDGKARKHLCSYCLPPRDATWEPASEPAFPQCPAPSPVISHRFCVTAESLREVEGGGIFIRRPQKGSEELFRVTPAAGMGNQEEPDVSATELNSFPTHATASARGDGPSGPAAWRSWRNRQVGHES